MRPGMGFLHDLVGIEVSWSGPSLVRHDTRKNQEEAGMKEIRFRVPDMSCGHCEAAVRGSLETLEGVETVAVSLETKEVAVRSIVELDLADLMGAVSAVGFTPEAV